MIIHLHPYQKRGVERLLEGSLLLADEMGLGKTVQAIAALNSLSPADRQRVMIVCPKSLIPMWQEALMNQYDALLNLPTVTNYERVPRIASHPVDVLIVDEAHAVKNRKALRSQLIAKWAKVSKRTWLLTGTPVLNNPSDLWHLLHVIAPDEFDSYWRFYSNWCVTSYSPFARSGKIVPGVKHPVRFAEMCNAHSLSRTKRAVMPELGKVQRQVIPLEMALAQKRLYQRVKKEILIELGDSSELTLPNALARIIALRQICVTPRRFEPTDPPGVKFEFIRDFLDGNSKPVVIFSGFRSALLLLQEFMGDHPSIVRYDGQMNETQRREALEQWNADPAGVLLATIQTAGVGMNLVHSSTCVFLDEPWVPAIFEQAIARFDRIGQTETVTAITLRCVRSIEQDVARCLEGKGDMLETIRLALEKEAE